LLDLRIYCISRNGLLSRQRSVRGSFDNRIFQQMRLKPTKFKNVFATTAGEVYPVSSCLHNLSDALWYVAAGSWLALQRNALECSVFTECFQVCRISQRKLRNRHTTRYKERCRKMNSRQNMSYASRLAGDAYAFLLPGCLSFETAVANEVSAQHSIRAGLTRPTKNTKAKQESTALHRAAGSCLAFK